MESSLDVSSNPAYHELHKRIIVFKNRYEAEKSLESGKFGVYAGITNAKYFVTYDWNEELNLLSSFRLMKKLCIFNFYTVFAFQKFSPYTELFSHYALQLSILNNFSSKISFYRLYVKISGIWHHTVLV